VQRRLLLNTPLDFSNTTSVQGAMTNVLYIICFLRSVLYMAPLPALAMMNVWITIIRLCRLAHVLMLLRMV
jgi:hypothetical protein